MSTVRELHQSAMEHTDLAIVAQREGRAGDAKLLYRLAFDYERQAAALLATRFDAEPTRSILHRSAASLALDCGEHRQAEILISEGLRGDPPEQIAEELRDLFEQVSFRRHLALRNIELTDTEMQMSIAGPSIGFGIAPVSNVLPRIQDAERLVYRTAERLKRMPFRRGGPIPLGLLSSVEVFATVPRAASFALSIKIGHSQQTNLFGEPTLGEQIIDDVLTCLEAFNDGNEQALRRMIPQDDYYTNFVALARNIGPDGAAVNFVGFSAVRNGVTRNVSLTGNEMRAIALPTTFAIAALAAPQTDESSQITIEGVLKEADSRNSSKGTIHVVDREGTSHTVQVPPEMMSDIVKPLWESHVIVVGERRKKVIHLIDIRPARPQLPSG